MIKYTKGPEGSGKYIGRLPDKTEVVIQRNDSVSTGMYNRYLIAYFGYVEYATTLKEAKAAVLANYLRSLKVNQILLGNHDKET